MRLRVRLEQLGASGCRCAVCGVRCAAAVRCAEKRREEERVGVECATEERG